MEPEDCLVYLAGVAWDAVPGTDRHLVRHLSRSVSVVWVDPPLSIAHAIRARDYRSLRSLARVTQVANGIRRVSLLAPPFPTRRGMEHISARVLTVGLGRVFDRSHLRPVGMVNTAPYVSFDILGKSGPGRRLYYATDDFIAGAELLGQSRTGLAKAEARRLSEADVAAAVSPRILDRWGAGSESGKSRFVLPNGCDVEHYSGVDTAPLPDDVHLPGPIAGVVGQFSARIDLALLEAVADTQLSLLLVGPRQPGWATGRFEALAARPNVVWVGEKTFDELPSYLRLIDVGLTPYVESDFNRSSFPLKTLEYLAAGRAAVSTPLPAVAALDTEWVTTAATPTEFARAASDLARAPRTSAQFDGRRAFAAKHSWATRAEQMLQMMGAPVTKELRRGGR